jgi:hypothetical protein
MYIEYDILYDVFQIVRYSSAENAESDGEVSAPGPSKLRKSVDLVQKIYDDAIAPG